VLLTSSHLLCTSAVGMLRTLPAARFPIGTDPANWSEAQKVAPQHVCWNLTTSGPILTRGPDGTTEQPGWTLTMSPTAWDWVSTQLRVVAHGDGERERRTVTAHGLRELYTSHVIGDEMMLLWNNGFGLLSHEVGAGVDPTDERLALVERFARFIIEELLKVDSHPTVTSFFTFARNCAPHAHHALHRYASSRAPRDVHASGPRQRGHCRSHRLVTAPRPRAGLQVTIPLCLCELRGLRAGGQWLLLTGVISGPRARRHWHRLIGILRLSDSRPIQRRAAPVVGWITSFASHES